MEPGTPYRTRRALQLARDLRGHPHPAINSLRRVSTCWRLIDDLFRLGIPVKSLAAPVRLRGHDGHNRMRKPVIHVGVRLASRLHGLEPVHEMDHAVVDRKSTRLNSSHLGISY